MTAPAEIQDEHEHSGAHDSLDGLTVNILAPAILALVLLAVMYATVVYVTDLVTLSGVLGTVLTDDPPFMIQIQLAGFGVFLLLLLGEFLVLHQERCLTVAPSDVKRNTKSDVKRNTNWVQLLGISERWLGAIQNGVVSRASRGGAEILLSQHFSARTAVLRVLLAAFPTTGFIGTVLGIREAIAPLDELIQQGAGSTAISGTLGDVVGGLELAFDTTLIGLIMLLAGSLLTMVFTSALRSFHTSLLIRK